MGKKTITPSQPVNCACVIHGDVYSFDYVDKLYNMLSRHFTQPVNLHVYTEAQRPVPAPYIRHNLIQWPQIVGPKKSWWYKLQLFDRTQWAGPLIYFDLDVVIVNKLDWLADVDLTYFWTIHDFKRLYKKDFLGINSSVMSWNNQKFGYIWDNISNINIHTITSRFRGDQDYLQTVIDKSRLKYFPLDKIVSWRWQALRGSNPAQTRIRPNVNAGTEITPDNSVLVFHGQPKPHQINDPVIQKFWQ